jgi:hypothetical protein
LPPALPARHSNLKLALLLRAAAMLAALGLMPYVLALMPQQFAQMRIPVPAIIAIQMAQSAALCFLLGWLGLYLGAPRAGCAVAARTDRATFAARASALGPGNSARHHHRSAGARLVAAGIE